MREMSSSRCGCARRMLSTAISDCPPARMRASSPSCASTAGGFGGRRCAGSRRLPASSRHPQPGQQAPPPRRRRTARRRRRPAGRATRTAGPARCAPRLRACGCPRPPPCRPPAPHSRSAAACRQAVASSAPCRCRSPCPATTGPSRPAAGARRVDLAELDAGLVARLHQPHADGDVGAVAIVAVALQRMAAGDDARQRRRGRAARRTPSRVARRCPRCPAPAARGRRPRRAGSAVRPAPCGRRRLGGHPIQRQRHARRRQRQAHVGEIAQRPQRIGEGIGDAHRRAHVVAFAEALGAQRRERAGVSRCTITGSGTSQAVGTR
jgi:hypothetical protein